MTGVRDMHKLLNVIADLQSVFAIGLAAALILGAFEAEHLDSDLQKNALSADSKGAKVTLLERCDGVLSEPCAVNPVNGDRLVLSGFVHK
jgi:hypothetical protein